jgi:hypothetical protein
MEEGFCSVQSGDVPVGYNSSRCKAGVSEMTVNSNFPGRCRWGLVSPKPLFAGRRLRGPNKNSRTCRDSDDDGGWHGLCFSMEPGVRSTKHDVYEST